jgi:tetratricopeptide (TPR) repeat protein
MSNYSRLQKLDAQIRQLKGVDRNADVTGILQAALRDAEDSDEKLYILSRLASEYQLLNRLEAAEDAIRKQIDLDPNKPEAWLQLATHYYRYMHDLPKALSIVEVAVERAEREGNFVRQVYAERIRIALEMKNYQLVENSLAKLIEYTPKPGSIDVELESDFLPRIPAINSGVRTDLIENYRRLAHHS